MTDDVIHAKYNELYDKAKKIFDDNDLCGFKKNNGICNSTGGNRGPYCCCSGQYDGAPVKSILGKNGYHCGYFKEGSGCSVKSLACKTWTCGFFSSNAIIKELEKIKYQTFIFGFFAFRGTYEDAIKIHPSIYQQLLKVKSFEEF